MHVPCMPKRAWKPYMQPISAKKYVVVANLDVLLHFLAFPLPSCSKTPSMPHSSKSATRKL